MHCLRNQVGAISRVQLQSDIFDMPLDGAGRDVDFQGDLFGRTSDGHQFEYLMFTKGQMRFKIQSVSMHSAIP